ncbi:50S ribosomal protein L3 [Candidatus Gottesmanbacteria bacterium RIFCSPHIGHO2_02_FULL_39_14]|uniref:Large ribosomal subunit protein uL3 n=2 Tax=Candidatus Gottesmaniibacteriota TaxID=1752720 RepID=A0A1F5ZU32_9BACT|nr:MAG: 50S ribosomal protein L3 [Candidatus Gottesmanbacteria bacterium RIFCSPHIGHO2_02_FULL_39_14]OGG31261.1 MAG: 50S ribosomal protein L3 [Candidatus Gottesmanbacteria bacterium RIFCSPLOWO2_02_FULL_38_8]
MMNSLIGTKINQSQMFDEKGMRIAVTNILAGPCVVVSIKEEAKDGFNAVIVGFGQRRLITVKKPIQGILKKAGIIEKPPRFYKELRITSAKDEKDVIKLGQSISVGDVLKEGDIVQVTGTSKGAGFAGVVKRHHFKGGPRTHGQSDRERAPGSIGQTTTPGRVYKGKRMAGRMGNQQVTVKNLKVIKIDPEKNLLTVKGLVTGKRNSLLVIKKMEK